MARTPPHYKGTTVSHAWSIDTGVMRVECDQGHSEAIGDDPPMVPVPPCDSCERERIVIARGPFVYDPDNADQRAAMSALAPWGVP